MSQSFPFRMHHHVRDARRSTGTDERFTSEVRPGKKDYLRMPHIVLTPSSLADLTIEKALAARSSERYMDPAKPLPFEDLASLLVHGAAARDNMSRPYPSGGALYPVEIYVLVKNVTGLEAGAYHFDPHGKALDQLWAVEDSQKLYANTMEWANDAPAAVLFTGMWGRNHAKYKDFGYLLGMLETGHAAQNILLLAAAHGISACPLAGFDDEAASTVFDLDQSVEQPIYTIALGYI